MKPTCEYCNFASVTIYYLLENGGSTVNILWSTFNRQRYSKRHFETL